MVGFLTLAAMVGLLALSAQAAAVRRLGAAVPLPLHGSLYFFCGNRQFFRF